MAKKQDDEPLEGSVPVNDAWTGLLAISLIALAVATGFLAWDWYQYDEEAVARMKLPKLAGTPPKKLEGEAKKAEEKKVEEKKAEEKKDEAKKDAALRPIPTSRTLRTLALATPPGEPGRVSGRLELAAVCSSCRLRG